MNYADLNGKKLILDDGSVGVIRGSVDFFKGEVWIDWIKPSLDLVTKYRARGGYSHPYSIITLDEAKKYMRETL